MKRLLKKKVFRMRLADDEERKVVRAARLVSRQRQRQVGASTWAREKLMEAADAVLAAESAA